MIRYVAFVSFAGLAACAAPIPVTAPVPVPVPAEPEPTPAPNPGSAKQRFIAAAEANGCIVNEQTAPAILSGATLSQTDLARILTELQNEGLGRITPDQRGFEITTDNCVA